MSKNLKYIVILGIVFLGIYIYPKISNKISGKYEDRIDCTFYGFGHPNSIELNNGNKIKIGPYRYELTIEKFNTEKDGLVSLIKIEGQELELVEDGWTIPKIFNYSEDNVEYEFSKPIYWEGSFEMKIASSIASIKGVSKSTFSNDLVDINVDIPVIEENDQDYKLFRLDNSVNTCFDLEIGKQRVSFCNSQKHFIDSMIDLVERKYNIKLNQNRKDEIYAKYESNLNN